MISSKWIHEGRTPKSNRFRCPECGGIAFYPQNNYRKQDRAQIGYVFCPYCASRLGDGEAAEAAGEEGHVDDVR